MELYSSLVKSMPLHVILIALEMLYYTQPTPEQLEKRSLWIYMSYFISLHVIEVENCINKILRRLSVNKVFQSVANNLENGQAYLI